MPSHADIITQAELQHVLDLETQNRAAQLAIRDRLLAGAAVETGPLSAETKRYDIPPDSPERSPADCIGTGQDHFGITVGPTEFSAEVVRTVSSLPETLATLEEWLSPPRVALPRAA